MGNALASIRAYLGTYNLRGRQVSIDEREICLIGRALKACFSDR